jgi:hypothetical protein
MQFDVSEWMGPGSYIDFETAELDDYSYLFCNPSFTNPNRVGFRVAGVRVAVNGRVPVSGQAFRNVDAFVGTTDQNLARLCSVVAKDRGVVLDEFTIEFEVIGDFANIVDEPPPVVVPDTSVADPLPDTGVRDFDRINETMASITGVLPDFVADTFAEVKEQLPSGYDLRSFVSSHQMGIARLSVEYCDSLLDSPPLREAFFGAALDFDANIDFCGVERSVIVDALIDGVLGVDLLNQPDVADMRDVLDSLIIGPDAPADPVRSCPGGLTASCNEGGIPGVCDPDRSTTIAKAACTAVLSSAAVSLH